MFNIFLKCNKSNKRNKNSFSLLTSVFVVFPHLTLNILISILFSRKYKKPNCLFIYKHYLLFLLKKRF